MSAALPIADPCCIASCDDVLVQNIPGPAGTNGADGADGADGASAVTTLTVAFTMPAELASDTATVVSTAGFTIGENVYVQGLGTLQVTAIASATGMTLKNLEDAATSAYASNAAAGTVAAIGSRISPTGLQGPAGLLAGSAAGPTNLKGFYPDPLLSIPNALGALAVGNGTDAVSLSAGTQGHIPVSDATTFPATGIGYMKAIPVTGDANVATDRLVRLSAATGLPIPLTASKASLKDPGGAGVLVADSTTGNARGTDAVDLQVSRAAVGVSAVASGSRAVIAGGQDNTASAAQSVVVGGTQNANSGSESFIGGGNGNIVDSAQSAIVGGDTNKILGGTIIESFIGGGVTNKINGAATQAVLAGGKANTVSSEYGAILGGSTNIVTGKAAVIVGGINATADKHGQRTFSSGAFSTQADCQQSDLIWRLTTTGAGMGIEAFLDGAAGLERAIIPAGTTWAFDILVTARSLDAGVSVSAAWIVRGAISNTAGTTAIVGTVTNTVIADGTSGTWGTSGGVTVDADNANDALRIRVNGYAGTTIRWGIHGRIMEVGH